MTLIRRPDDRHETPLVVISIGGNSLIKDSEHLTVADQYAAVGETALHIVPIVREGYRVVVTHGNGPQVGFILLRSDLARDILHEVPLVSCVADTQGAIGYQIAQTLQNEMHRQGVDKEVAAVVTLVVAVGGGGIPVVRDMDGNLSGRDAVIDKDAASCILANALGASVLIQSTCVDRVALNFNTPQQVDIDHMNAAQCRRYLDEGHFAPGSMRPKIEAALGFLEQGGKRVIITQPHHLQEDLHAIYGTHIIA